MSKKDINLSPTARDQEAAVSEFGNKHDVARHFRVSRRSVDHWLAIGCPHLKLSKRMVRFSIPEVAAWLSQNFRTQRRGAA